MFDALYIGATGMQAQQLDVNTIANNLANINTTGFKKGRVSFTDLMSLEATRLGSARNATGPSEAGLDAGPLGSLPGMGAGVGVANVSTLFDLGPITQTGSAWDVAIQGDGFIEVTMADGSTAFTRGGTLKVNSDGVLATQSGQPLKPGIQVAANATAVTIGSDGTVTVSLPGQTTPVQAGQLQLVRFASPTALVAQGNGLYKPSDASGEPIPGKAGQDGIGAVQQGSLEGSNVQLVDEMVNLMVAQRAYEANLKVVQASDELLGMVNNLRK